MRILYTVFKCFIFSACIDNNPSGTVDKRLEKKPDTTTQVNMEWERDFKNSCAVCHHPDRDLTGPALRNAVNHFGTIERAVAYVQNSVDFDDDSHVKKMRKEFSKYTHTFRDLGLDKIKMILYWCEPCSYGAKQQTR